MLKRSLLLLSLLGPAWTLSANSFLVNASVQSQVDAQGLGADACQRAGVTLVRNNIPNQVAIQLGGADPLDPTRIFTRPGVGSYFLTDVGTQWSSAVSQGQTLLAITETIAGQHGWTGADYAGASQGTAVKADIVAGRLQMADLLMTRLPSPSLLQGDLSSVYLRIPSAPDPSGLGSGLRLWRKDADLGNASWQAVRDLQWPSSGPQDVTDTGVTANAAYIYGVSYIYAWPGGQGAGAEPNTPNIYITNAKGLSNRIVANNVQPTPTPFPTLVVSVPTPNLGQESWIAYPNPLMGSDLYLAFKTERPSAKYTLVVHGLDGEKVLEVKGIADTAGWQKPLIQLKKLSSGIYLVRLTISETGLDEKILPVRKLAIIK